MQNVMLRFAYECVDVAAVVDFYLCAAPVVASPKAKKSATGTNAAEAEWLQQQCLLVRHAWLVHCLARRARPRSLQGTLTDDLPFLETALPVLVR